MRLFAPSFFAGFVLAAATTVSAFGQGAGSGCTGLCLQQVSCPNGGTTTVTGKVYAPNGVDPLPGVIVYVPNSAVSAFTPGVSCSAPGTNPSGTPLVGDYTAIDGSFTITNFPVGQNIPLVAVTGHWRRQVVIPSVAACTTTPFSTRMPKNQTEGDIPHFAISTGASDAVECVMRKVGLDDAEFTDPSGNGRIHMYTSTGNPGSSVSTSTPNADTLMGSLSTLNNYDVVMLPCEGNQYTKPGGELANLVQWANEGGRVYTSHFGYEWMYKNPPFDSVVNWAVGQSSPPDGTAVIDQTFQGGEDLSNWLTDVGASTTPGQIAINTLKHDFNGVVAPTQSWMTLNNAAYSNPVMQFTFNTPVAAATANQCGRVLYNEYHVENPLVTLKNYKFPNECSNAAMTPQEKLLEFMLFDLTADNDKLTLSPSSLSFGNTNLGFSSAPQTITVTNTGLFEATVAITVTGAFQIVSNNCSVLLAGQSCTFSVVFVPTGTGPQTGTITVTLNGKSTTATLNGNGVPTLSSTGNLSFGNLDVGAAVTKTLTITNNAGDTVPLATPTVTGDFALGATTCGAALSPNQSCTLQVTFRPTTTGSRTGVATVAAANASYGSITANIDGTGVDFSLALSSSASTMPAGFGAVLTSLTTTPLAGFNAPVTLTCTSNAPGSTCQTSSASFIPSQAVVTNVTIGTTSPYTVIGYGGSGRNLMLLLLTVGSGTVLYRRRKDARHFRSTALLALVALGLATTLTTGCGGTQPAANTPYTTPGTYAFTLTVTDGFLVHSQTYNLTVTKN